MCKFTTFILLCSAFSVFTLQLSAQNADLELLRQINNTKETVGYSKFISNTTTHVAFGVPVVMGVVALLEKDDELLKNTLFVGVSIGLGGVLTQALKHSINRPRPITLADPSIVAYEPQRDLSFPSGHTSLAFSAATALSLKYPKWYVIVPGYLWAGSVGYSRMNLGVHYPSDVLAGAVLGAGSAYVTYKVNNWFWKKHQNKKLIGLQSYL